jgi:hypothetical protein
MKSCAIFVVSNAIGHLNPALEFAKQLKLSKGINSYFVVEDTYKSYILKHGLFTIKPNSSPFGIGIENVLFPNTFSGYLDSLIHRVLNSIFTARKKDYVSWIRKVKPSFIFLDSQLEPDMVVINSIPNELKFEVLLLQTTFYDQIRNHYPALFSSYLPNQLFQNRLVNFRFVLLRFFSWALHFIKFIGFDDVSLIRKNNKNNVSNVTCKVDPFAINGLSSTLRKLVLLPMEMEFPNFTICKSTRYLGSFIRGNSLIETEGDDFLFINARSKYTYIIYISLGTLHFKHSKGKSKGFFERMLSLAKMKPDTLFMISLGGEKRFWELDIPLNVRIDENVSQFYLLGKVDLFITHGGVNSVMESIHQECPMLVIPMNQFSDQNGNAARVEYYHLGRRIQIDDPISKILFVINQILGDSAIYKQNLIDMMVRIDYKSIS